MKLKELVSLMDMDAKISIWAQDRDGQTEEVFGGTVGRCPFGLMKFDITDITCGHYFIEVTLDEVPKGYL